MYCDRCGQNAPCTTCPDFDRDGQYIWENQPRFCEKCGVRTRGPHACTDRCVIRFYSVGDAYGEFSNFALFPIRLGGKLWPTSEHYFQAMKFEGTAHSDVIRGAANPGLAARWGRDRKRPLRKDWQTARFDVMRRALHAKFTQHAELGQLLVSTGNAKLVEHTDHDAFWGDGAGRGKNHLGRLLMLLREDLSPLRNR